MASNLSKNMGNFEESRFILQADNHLRIGYLATWGTLILRAPEKCTGLRKYHFRFSRVAMIFVIKAPRAPGVKFNDAKGGAHGTTKQKGRIREKAA